MQAGKKSSRNVHTSTPACTQSDEKGIASTVSQRKARPPRAPLRAYLMQVALKTAGTCLISALKPGDRRSPGPAMQPPMELVRPNPQLPVYDQLMQIPTVDDKGDGGGDLSSLMRVVHRFLGTPRQLREQLAWMTSPAALQTMQCRFDQLQPAFARVSDEQVSRMPPGAQLMLGPSDGARPDDLFSPAVYLGLSDLEEIMVRSAFKGSLLQSRESRDSAGLEEILTKASPDGWGYVVTIPSDAGVCFWVKPDAPPLVADHPILLRLPEGCHLLVQIPFGAARALTAAQPAIFLGARQAPDGRIMLHARAPWAPAHEDPSGLVSHKHTAILNTVADTAMHMRTHGEVPQPGEYAIGPGPADPLPDVSGGWFEWEAALPVGTVVVVDPYYDLPPESEPGVESGDDAPTSDAFDAADDEPPQVSMYSGEPDVADTKGSAPVTPPTGSSAPVGGLTYKQFLNMAHDSKSVQVTDVQGRTIPGEFVGAADWQTEAPNAVWVVAARGALTGALRCAPVPNEPGNFAYLVSLATHRVDLTQE